MVSKYLAVLIVVVAVDSIAVRAEPAQTPIQPETMAAAKSSKADAYDSFRKATAEALGALAKDKSKALASTDKSQEGWRAEFRPTASADIVQRVQGAFAGLRKAVESGTRVDYNIQRQVIDKSMLDQVIPEMETALQAKKFDDAMSWFQVYVVKFELEKTANEVVPPVKAALASPDAAKTRIALLALRKHIAGQAIDEVSEAPENIEKKNTDRAQVVTTEGRTYFLGIQNDFNRRVSKPEGDRVLKTYDDVRAASKAGDEARAKRGFEQIRTSLAKYQGILTQAMNSGGAKD